MPLKKIASLAKRLAYIIRFIDANGAMTFTWLVAKEKKNVKN
jgi:hypothetical protein